MHPIFNRRFLADTLACLFLSGAGFAAGWAVAPDLIAALAEMVGIGAVMMTSPTDRFVVSLKLAFAFALPGAVTWVALLLYRGRMHMRPPLRGIAALVSFPWIVGFVAEAIRTASLASVLESSATYGVEAMISAVEFSSGTWASRAIAASAVVLWIIVLRLTGRPKDVANVVPEDATVSSE